jgi:hypothetical protein
MASAEAQVYALVDAGNKGGHKMFFVLFSYYDLNDNCVKLKTIDNLDCLGDGEANAAAVWKAVQRLGCKLLGTGTDNAGDVLTTMIAELRKLSPTSLNSTGCLLHVYNIILNNAYMAAFGDEEWGVPGSLRRGFMVAYLIEKFPDEWRSFCVDHGLEAHLVASASKGRWWSMLQSNGDIDRQKDSLIEFFTIMSNTQATTSVFRDLFKTVAAWLENPKINADSTMVTCFCNAWWSNAMSLCQRPDPSMSHLDTRNQLGGFAAMRMTRRDRASVI